MFKFPTAATVASKSSQDFSNSPTAALVASGLGLTVAVVKASLVGLFFMHLIESRPTVWAVVVVSLFWVSIVLFGLTFTDYMTRSWFPHVPGH